MAKKYDIIVIGTGPAGHGAAIQAAKLGFRVAAIERKEVVGGNLVAAGSIPSKALRESILYLTGLRQREIYGLSYSLKADLTVQDLMLRHDLVIRNQIQVLKNQFSRNGIELIKGEASFLNPNTIAVRFPGGSLNLEADIFVIATGSQPARSPSVPINGRTILDSDGVFQLESIPRSLIVVGVGPIGAEYACMFASLGAEVTLVDMRTQVLQFLDAEIREALLYHMRGQGVSIRLGEEMVQVVDQEGRVIARTKSNKRITGEVLLYAVGRNGCTQHLNLQGINLTTDDRGRIPVNNRYKTSVPHIYAVGDVIGFPALASTSMEQGREAVMYATGHEEEWSSAYLPYGLYTIPEISMVGRTEEDLTQAGISYEVGLARYRETARGQIIGDDTGLLKILVHSEDRTILGVHIIGESAAELVHIGKCAIDLGGTVDFLVNTTFNYPTLAECYRIAALDTYNKLT